MEQKTLTKNEIKRIFALYYGCAYKWKLEGGKETIVNTVDFSAVCNLDFEEPTNCKLQLRNLESLKKAEIFKLCKLFAETEFGDYRFTLWQITKNGVWRTYSKNYNITHVKSNFYFSLDVLDGVMHLYEKGKFADEPYDNMSVSIGEYIPSQWYFKNGFAVPIYPHGKNPFELGIAVDVSEPTDLEF